MRKHTVKSGDSLSKIAKKYYDDVGLVDRLAAFNGILDKNKIHPGQIIYIPTKTELIGEPATPPPVDNGLITPHGLDQIREEFGDIFNYIGSDTEPKPGWESKYITHATLPYAIPYTYKEGLFIKRLRCHVKLKKIIISVFNDIEELGLRNKIRTCGGCYNFRLKRGGNSFSTHSWGIAIDLNDLTNQMGTRGDMHHGIVQVFESYGFRWGGDWSGRRKNPMHFQFCSGY